MRIYYQNKKIEIIQDLVHKKILRAIEKHAVLSRSTWDKASFVVITESDISYDKSTESLLKIIWTQGVSVSSKTGSSRDISWHSDSWRKTTVSLHFNYDIMKEALWKGYIDVYKLLERQEHITPDDIFSKITEEVVELSEWIQKSDTENIYEEAGDILINIISLAKELWCNIDELLVSKPWERQDLFPLLWEWNEQVQALRGRYSRKQWSLLEVESLTKSFISTVLNYTDPSKNILEVIETNLTKLMEREWLYKPNINPRDYIAEYPNFPIEGVNFKDISPLLANPDALKYICHEMAERCRGADKIVALDARGFIFAPLMLKILGIPFIMARKPWKLPGETESISYDLEYWSNTIEIQKYDKDGNPNILPGEKVAIVDDLLATWGTAMAAINLIEKLGGEVFHAAFVIWLDEEFLLGKKERKELHKYSHSAVVSYND